MSKVIVRMEMPKRCFDCPMFDYVNDRKSSLPSVIRPVCNAHHELKPIPNGNERPDWCPIVGELPEQHGDLIDRDVLLEKAKQEQRFYKDEYDAMESGYLDEEREIVKEAYSTMTDCVSLINNAPTVDAVEVKHGKWEERYIEDANPLFRRRFYCSRCGNWTTYGKTLYCPNCGAKMDGEVKNNAE